jgi:hypothetical protein
MADQGPYEYKCKDCMIKSGFRLARPSSSPARPGRQLHCQVGLATLLNAAANVSINQHPYPQSFLFLNCREGP